MPLVLAKWSSSPLRLQTVTRVVPFPRTLAGWVVLSVYVASVALLLNFVAKHVSRVPYADEYANLPFLFTSWGTSPSAYWSQHNEHRIPLPRLAYVAAMRVSGMDFRAPVYLNSALLCAATAFLLRAVHRVRGRFAIPDAFIPLMVLGLGGWENLLWGFQVQFVISTVLVLTFIGLVVEPGFAASRSRIIAASAICVLLPMCGANGVALVPAFSLYLFCIAATNLREADSRRLGWLALFGGLLGIAIVAAYFIDLERVASHAAPKTLESVAIGAVNFVGMGMGAAVHLMHRPGYAGITALGVLMSTFTVVTAILLVRGMRVPETRQRSAAMLCVLIGLACLGLGLAYGRAGMSNITHCSRYVTLAMPIPILLYFAWVSLVRGVAAHVLPFAFLGLTLVAFVPNTRFAYTMGELQSMRLRKIEYEIQSGIPLGFIVDRNPFVYPGSMRDFRTSMEILRAAGIEPFRHVRLDPAMTEEQVPIRIVKIMGMEEANGEFIVKGDAGTIILALPRKQHIYGFAMTYEATTASGGRPIAFVSWDDDVRSPPAQGYGMFDHFARTDGPTVTRIFVDQETNLLRIDLFWVGSKLRIHELAILTPSN